MVVLYFKNQYILFVIVLLLLSHLQYYEKYDYLVLIECLYPPGAEGSALLVIIDPLLSLWKNYSLLFS